MKCTIISTWCVPILIATSISKMIRSEAWKPIMRFMHPSIIQKCSFNKQWDIWKMSTWMNLNVPTGWWHLSLNWRDNYFTYREAFELTTAVQILSLNLLRLYSLWYPKSKRYPNWSISVTELKNEIKFVIGHIYRMTGKDVFEYFIKRIKSCCLIMWLIHYINRIK